MGTYAPEYQQAAGPGNIPVGLVIHQSSVPATTPTTATVLRAVPVWGKWPFEVRLHTA